jgi:hypothetical protein
MINCMIVPTGIGASIGGFAGDANPYAKKLAKVSKFLISHPNVVNGAIFTDIPENLIVVEGALLDLFFQGEIALRPYVDHKIAVVVDSAAPKSQREITMNCINAARTFYGSDIIEKIFYTEEPVDCDLEKINNPKSLLKASSQAIDAGASALALLCVLPEGDEELEKRYSQGLGYDPIGLIEAKISHLVSREFLIPSAHAPLEKEVFRHQGIVSPKVAAEHIGLSFLPSVIKCLERSAGIIPINEVREGDIKVEDLNSLIVPYDCCDGIPMHEVSKRAIDLICIEENTTIENKTASSLALRHKVFSSYDSLISYNARVV